MDIKIIGVIGAGQMGSGIAQVFATRGFEVVMQDVEEQFCERGLNLIKSSLDKMVSKGKLSKDECDAVLERIKTTTNMEDLQKVNFAIEAATEELSLKKEIFKRLDELLPPDVILASNTSSLSISKLASVTKRPVKVIGMHFMNPVPLIKGVEVISSPLTDKDTEKTVIDLAQKLDKTVIRSKDKAGFVANRILMPMINEAIFTLSEKVAKKEDIDSCMTACCNFPMGPLALADLIGLDTVESILNIMYTELGDPKYKPCLLLEKYVKEGKLGRKTKEGFYEY